MATPPGPSPTPTLPPCARGLTGADLSAYRDGMPIGGDTGVTDAHIAGCPACRTRMEQLDQLADTLRAERVPEPDERLWQAVRRAAEDAPARRFGMRWPLLASRRGSLSGDKRPLWSGLGALAAVLLLVLGFAQLFALHNASQRVTRLPTSSATPFPTWTPFPTLTPAPTAMPAPQLVQWQPVAFPIDTGSVMAGAPVAVQFAGDGESAYICAVGEDASGGLLSIWHTSDRGAHWIQAQQIPANPTINACELVVDVSDPSVAALAWQPRGSGGGDSYTGLMTTTDGGVTWQNVPPQPLTRIDQLDSRGGVIYALRETTASDNSAGYHLWASRDRMRTWQQVDHGLTADIAGFWLQPDTRAILVVLGGGAYNGPVELWSSPDDGATWHQIAAPVVPPSYAPARLPNGPSNNSIVVLAHASHAMQICIDASTPGLASAVTCSYDGGQSWQSRPALSGTLPDQYDGPGLIAITNDGSVLAAAPAGTSSGYGLYRLKPGASSWQLLGNLPQLNVTYCPGGAAGAGTLWASQPPYTDLLDRQHPIFTAVYTP